MLSSWSWLEVDAAAAAARRLLLAASNIAAGSGLWLALVVRRLAWRSVHAAPGEAVIGAETEGG